MRLLPPDESQERQASAPTTKKSFLTVAAESHRIRNALLDRQNVNPDEVHAEKMEALAEKAAHTPKAGATGTPESTTAS